MPQIIPKKRHRLDLLTDLQSDRDMITQHLIERVSFQLHPGLVGDVLPETHPSDAVEYRSTAQIGLGVLKLQCG